VKKTEFKSDLISSDDESEFSVR